MSDSPVAGQRRSRQRQLILESVQGRFDHPTAQEVHQALTLAGHTIGLATVYRNLAQLVEAGVLRTVTVEGTVRYDAHIADHAHLVDAESGDVRDVEMPPEVAKLIQAALAADGHEVDIEQIDLVVRARKA